MLNRNTRLSEGNSLRMTIPGNTPQRPSGQHQGKQEEEVEEEQLRTLWCGGISEKVDEEILYELFLNAGPLERVVIPKDRETKKQKNFAFIVFQHEETTNFAYELLNGTELFKQPIRLQNKTTGLGLGGGGGGYNQRSGGQGHYRSFSTPAQHQQFGQMGAHNGAPGFQRGGGNDMGGYQVPYGYNNMNNMGGQGMYNMQMNAGGWDRDRNMRGERDMGSRNNSRDESRGRERDRSYDGGRDRSYDGGRERDRHYRRY